MSMFLDLKQVDALGSSKPSITILSCDGMSSVSGRAGTVFVHSGSPSYFLDDSGLVLSASASSGEMIAGVSRARRQLNPFVGNQSRNASGECISGRMVVPGISLTA